MPTGRHLGKEPLLLPQPETVVAKENETGDQRTDRTVPFLQCPVWALQFVRQLHLTEHTDRECLSPETAFRGVPCIQTLTVQ